MLYLSNEAGTAVGSILNALHADSSEIKIELNENSLVVTLSNTKKKKMPKAEKPVKDSPKKKNGKKREYRTIISYNGESLTSQKWAEKLGVDRSTVLHRVRRHGNPYGAKGPGPSQDDKIIAGL